MKEIKSELLVFDCYTHKNTRENYTIHSQSCISGLKEEIKDFWLPFAAGKDSGNISRYR